MGYRILHHIVSKEPEVIVLVGIYVRCWEFLGLATRGPGFRVQGLGVADPEGDSLG